MLIPITDAHGILLDLRYGSVDNLLGRAIYSRAVALLRRPARDALLSAYGRWADLPAEVVRNGALPLGLMTACGWDHDAPEWWHDHLPGREAHPALSSADVPDGPMETSS